MITTVAAVVSPVVACDPWVAPYRDDRVEMVLSAPDQAGVDLEYFTVGESVPGLEVTEGLPVGFDWRRAESVHHR